MQYENGKHKSASESDIQEVLSKQGQSVLHITYLTWVSLGQFLSPTIDWESDYVALFHPHCCCDASSQVKVYSTFEGTMVLGESMQRPSPKEPFKWKLRHICRCVLQKLIWADEEEVVV